MKCALIQCSNPINDEAAQVVEFAAAMLRQHLPLIDEATRQGVQILCPQEIFDGPDFCASMSERGSDDAEAVPGSPTLALMQQKAKDQGLVLIVLVFEREMAGVNYNPAAVMDADGSYFGNHRKNHIPDVNPGFLKKMFLGDISMEERRREVTDAWNQRSARGEDFVEAGLDVNARRSE